MNFKLNQIEGTLYALSTGATTKARSRLAERPSATFRNQVKRLLEIDRANVRGTRSGQAVAFFEGLPEGRGTDAAYDAFGTFCLAIAMEMLRFGFKQREVVSKIASMRPRLASAYSRVLKSKSVQGSTYETTNEMEKLPTTRGGRNDGLRLDASVFLIADPVEQNKTGRKQIKARAEIECEICFGWDALLHFLKKVVPIARRSAFVVELSELVIRTSELLQAQPLRRRGRS